MPSLGWVGWAWGILWHLLFLEELRIYEILQISRLRVIIKICAINRYLQGFDGLVGWWGGWGSCQGQMQILPSQLLGPWWWLKKTGLIVVQRSGEKDGGDVFTWCENQWRRGDSEGRCWLTWELWRPPPSWKWRPGPACPAPCRPACLPASRTSQGWQKWSVSQGLYCFFCCWKPKLVLQSAFLSIVIAKASNFVGKLIKLDQVYGANLSFGFWSFARGLSVWMIICERPVHTDDYLQEAGTFGWSFPRYRSVQTIISKRPVHPDDHMQEASPSEWSFARGQSIQIIIFKKPVRQDNHLQEAGTSRWSYARGFGDHCCCCWCWRRKTKRKMGANIWKRKMNRDAVQTTGGI